MGTPTDTQECLTPESGEPEDGPNASGAEPNLDTPDLRSWPEINLSGVDLGVLVGLIGAVDLGAAGSRESLGVVAACEQVIRRLSAAQARFSAHAVEVTEVPDRDAHGGVSGEDLVAGEVAFLLALSPGQSRYRVRTAVDMVSDSAKLLGLVEAGDLDWKRATSIDQAMRAVMEPGTPQWNLVQDVMSVAALGASSHQVDAATREAIEVIDPGTDTTGTQSPATQPTGTEPTPVEPTSAKPNKADDPTSSSP